MMMVKMMIITNDGSEDGDSRWRFKIRNGAWEKERDQPAGGRERDRSNGREKGRNRSTHKFRDKKKSAREEAGREIIHEREKRRKRSTLAHTRDGATILFIRKFYERPNYFGNSTGRSRTHARTFLPRGVPLPSYRERGTVALTAHFSSSWSRRPSLPPY